MNAFRFRLDRRHHSLGLRSSAAFEHKLVFCLLIFTIRTSTYQLAGRPHTLLQCRVNLSNLDSIDTQTYTA